jgi:hypothetical protein
MLAAMATRELDVLAPPDSSRLAALLEAIADASRELCADLAPSAEKPAPLAPSLAVTPAACQVVDLASRRRAAGR